MFSVAATRLWNNLPLDIFNSPSVSAFKSFFTVLCVEILISCFSTTFMGGKCYIISYFIKRDTDTSTWNWLHDWWLIIWLISHVKLLWLWLADFLLNPFFVSCLSCSGFAFHTIRFIWCRGCLLLSGLYYRSESGRCVLKSFEYHY